MNKFSGPNFPKPYPKPYLQNPVEYPSCPLWRHLNPKANKNGKQPRTLFLPNGQRPSPKCFASWAFPLPRGSPERPQFREQPQAIVYLALCGRGEWARDSCLKSPRYHPPVLVAGLSQSAPAPRPLPLLPPPSPRPRMAPAPESRESCKEDRAQGGLCLQRHRHKSTDPKIGPGG